MKRYVIRREDKIKYYQEFYDYYLTKSFKRNISVNGSLVIEKDVISGFGNTNFATVGLFGTIPFSTAETFDFVMCFKYKPHSTFQHIVTENNVALGGYITITSESLVRVTFANSSGTRFIDITGQTQLQDNQVYYVWVEFTGTVYNIHLSTNGEDWVLEGSASSSTKPRDYQWNIGSANLSNYWYPFQSEIYLSKCSLKINGEYYWKGAEESSPRTELECTSTEPFLNLSGRNYFKTNSEMAIIAYTTKNNYTFPVLVSINPNAVTYGTSVNATTFPYKDTNEIDGQTWYIAAGDNAIQGSITSTIPQYRMLVTNETSTKQMIELLVNFYKGIDYQDTIKIAENVRSYNGDFTYRKKVLEVESTMDDYDKEVRTRRVYQPRTEDMKFQLTRSEE